MLTMVDSKSTSLAVTYPNILPSIPTEATGKRDYIGLLCVLHAIYQIAVVWK